MSQQLLREHQIIWQEKPALRAVYTDYYDRIVGFCQPGLTLEVGGGSGNLKEFAKDVICTDIVPLPWLDVAADAQALPFADSTFANIVCVDVLHHIERPTRFFSEAERVLTPGGRLVLLEPAITPVSGVFYRFFHPEPVQMGVDPLVDGDLDPMREPFDANQAIPTLLFGSHRARFHQRFPELRMVHSGRLSLVAYPLSGGFRPWGLIPASAVNTVLGMENALMPMLGWLAAFRLLVVLEKTPRAPGAGSPQPSVD